MPTCTSGCVTSRSGSTTLGARPCPRQRARARRHEVRVRRARRRDRLDRRDDDAGLVAVLAARRVPGRYVAAVVRQAVRPRLHGQHRLESRAARAAHAGRGDRLDERAVPRGVRAAHGLEPRRLVRARTSNSGSAIVPMRSERSIRCRHGGVCSSSRGESPARDRRPGRRDGRARASGARLHERRPGAHRQGDPARRRRRRRRCRPHAGRRDVRAAARQSGDRVVRGVGRGAWSRRT